MNTYQQRLEEHYEIRNRDVLAMLHDELSSEPEPVQLDGIEAAAWQAAHKNLYQAHNPGQHVTVNTTPDTTSLTHLDDVLRDALTDDTEPEPDTSMDDLSRALLKALERYEEKEDQQ